MRLRRPRPDVSAEGTTLGDDLPRDGFFDQPLVIAALRPTDPERLDDGRWQVTFRVTVKDAVGRRCPDLAVEATITGPHRTGHGMTTTDLLGAARFRMAGPPGAYRIVIDDVAAGALTWVRDGDTAEIDVS